MANEESIEFYKSLNVHPVGIPKDQISCKADISMTDAELVAFYSERYSDVDVENFLMKDHKERLYGFCNLIKEDEFYLDIGCANGGHMEILHQRGINGIGLDLSVVNVLRGREKYPYLKFVHGFAEEIPFKDDHFDIVMLGDIVGHFRSPKVTIAECLRVAKKGLAICFQIKEDVIEEYINHFTDQDILDLLEFYKLKINFFNYDGAELTKEDAMKKLQSFSWLLIRAEKTDETDIIVKKAIENMGKNLEKKSKEEILDRDQWIKDIEHNRHETEIARFKLVSHLVEGNNVLEIGCGNGDGSIEMAKNGFDVTGIDISVSGIVQATEMANKENVKLKTKFFVMDATKLSFSDNSFDSIVIPEVLEHIRSPMKLLGEAFRVVRNGGRIIITVPDGLLVPWEGHLRIFFRDTLTTELSQYTTEIEYHELSFKKWIICSFFVNKKELDIREGPLVDIIMPTFNGRKTIEKAIRSVINQTYQNWNLAVVNDGGEDICDIIKEFNDNRIKHICTENKGKPHALNIGITGSNGEYITYLDDDDILYPIHVEVLAKAALEKKQDFVYSDWYEISVDENYKEFRREIEFRLDVTQAMLVFQNYINHKCVFHKRSLLEIVGMYDEDLSILIDWDMIRRLAFVSKPYHVPSFTSERIRYYNNGILQNRITSLWSKDQDKVRRSIEKIVGKTIDLQATSGDLKEIIKKAMLSNSYYHTLIIQSKDIRIGELENILQSKDSKTGELENTLQSKYSKIEDLENTLQSKDGQMSNLNNEIFVLNDKLRRLESSISLRYVRSITSTVDKIFPDSTVRGDFRRIVVSSIRIIANEGIRSYFRHVGVKIKRKEFNIVGKEIGNIEDRNVQLQAWVAKNEPSQEKLEQYKNDAKYFKYRPKISIITPVYNPDIGWIKAVVESVLSQAYNNWELCIVDASTKKDIKKYLQDCAKKDTRIKVKFLIENKGIAGNSNEALSIATGEYIGLLDHDDEISPDALYEVVKYLQDNHADMIYSDEDKIDINGNRKDAFFKPDWSLDMFLSLMYTCHFGIYNKKIIDDIGGFRYGYDGSQDYDLVLRFVEKTNSIHHIPKILYHWRTVPGSVASTVDAKSYAYVSAKSALTDYIRRNNIKGEILDGFWTGSYRLKRYLYGRPLVSIIIPTRDKADILKRCVQSILEKTDYDNYEIIVVNNNSVDKETLDYFKSLKRIDNIRILDYSKEFNFSSINNFAVKNIKGDIVLFLNNDTEVISEGWMTAMLEHVQRDNVGAVGCKLLYPNKTVQHAGVILGLGGLAGHPHTGFPNIDNGYFGRINLIQNLSAVTAACMMMRKSVFEEVGGYDENIAVAFNDVDLCIKIREKGYLIVYTPYAELYHHESLSRGYEDTPEKQERFLGEVKYLRGKWGKVIDRGDPYYNPNLILSKGDFSTRI